MQKRSVQGRDLARILAEDLRNVLAGSGGNVLPDGATSTLTQGASRPDITNIGGDGDNQ